MIARPTSPETLWSELRLAELTRLARSPDAVPAALRAALSALGRRSALSAARAADELAEQPTWAAIARLAAFRGFKKLGAPAQAERQRSALSQLDARHPFLERMARELAGESAGPYSLPAYRAARALAEGRTTYAEGLLVTGLGDVSPSLAPLVAYEAYPMLLGLYTASGRHAEAERLIAQFLARYPESELGPPLRLSAALSALWRGERDPIEALAERETGGPGEPERQLARAVVQRLGTGGARSLVAARTRVELDASREPEREGRAVLGRIAGSGCMPGSAHSLAGLRLALERCGLPVVRCLLSEEQLPRLLAADAWVVVAEERPVGTGFARLVAHERASGLLLVERFDALGASLRAWEDQARRCQLHGFGALVVPREANSPLLRLHDPRLDALDACEVEMREAHAGRARAAHLSQAAATSGSEIPRAFQLRGEALVAQLRAGELEGSQADGPIESWYADARTRFEPAEWAHQLYAESLEHWNLRAEAAIAWSDAHALDSCDYRSLLGLSRSYLRQGYAEAAFALAEQALAQAPESLDSWLHTMEGAHSLGRAEAELLAHTVLERDPLHELALTVLATQASARGELVEACALYERAGESSKSASAPLAAALARLRLLDFEGALARAHEALSRSPEESEGYQLCALAEQALGAHEDALRTFEFALSRVGAEEALVSGYARALVRGAPCEARSERFERALALYAERTDVLLSFADELFEHGELEQGARFFEAAATHQPTALGPPFRHAQALLKRARWSDAEPRLAALVERDANAYFVALLDCVRRALGAEPALALVRRGSPDRQPALLWGVAHRVAELCGEERVRAGLRERLSGLPGADLVEAARFLGQHGLPDDGEALLALVAEHPDAREIEAARLRAQHAILRTRGAHEAATESVLAYHEAHAEFAVTDDELDSARRAGAPGPLAALAEKRLDYLLRRGDLSWGDGVHERALIALARAWGGKPGELAALRERLPAHPALCALPEAELASPGELT